MNNKETILFMALSVLACSCNSGKQQQAAVPQSRELITVQPGTVQTQESFTATISGRQDVDIYPQVSGRIEKLCITEGQTVKKGQTLLIIDQVPFQAALRVADANVRAAQAQAQSAALELEGKEALRKENVVSDFDLSIARSEKAKADAMLDQALAQQANARNDLSYTTVTSPTNGIAGNLPYREGALVNPGIEKPLTTVSDNSEMFVYFSLSESRLRQLIARYGSRENIVSDMPALQLRLADGTLYGHDGRIETISGVLNPNTGMVQMRCVFPNPEGMLMSGASGNILMPFIYDNVISIPAASAFEIQGVHFVQKVVDGKASTTQITVLDSPDGSTYIVGQGLESGDVIVAGGAGLIHDGDEIR